MKMKSYVILFLLIFTLLLTTGFQLRNQASDDEYIQVTIENGDTLWGLAKEFDRAHKLSPKQFVKWVEGENHVVGEQIQPGDKILIPVKKEDQFALGE